MRNFSAKIVALIFLVMAGGSLNAAANSDRLYEGESLYKGQSLRSNNGHYSLAMQHDGNLVLYRGGRALWASNTAGQAVDRVVMQGDGNLVIYGYPRPIWASNTAEYPGASLVVQDDGNVVIYIARKPIWATGTRN